MAVYRLAPFALALVGACGGAVDGGGGGDGDGNGTGGSDVVSLTIAPTTASLTVVDGAPVSQAFSVVAEFRDGTSADVTADAGWTFSQTNVGFVNAGVFEANGGAGGTGTVQARYGGAEAGATVNVFVETTRVVDGALAEAPEIFHAAAEDPALAPTIVYPSDGTYVPPNLGDFEVHWQPAAGTDLFEVSLTSAFASVTLYTTDNWEAFAVQEWNVLSQSAGGDPVLVNVRGLSTANPTAAGGTVPITMELTQEAVVGGIYYWAADGALPDGIYRHDMANPGEPAEPFYTELDLSEQNCVACHVLSRDGERMAVTYNGGNGPASIIDVATRTPQLATEGSLRWNFASFIPGSINLLATYQGQLSVLDGTTGAVVTPVPTNGWATHPDFAPDGRAIVYTEVAGTNRDWSFTGGRIVKQSYDTASGTFGAVTPLVTSAGNNYYPSWSPDAHWVLYNTSNEDAYDDASAELFVVAADGGAEPIKLNSPNVGGGLTNSWARWAPFAQTFVHPDGTREPLFWFTFSSKRAFGVRMPGGRPQIWMAPFFPARAAAGEDPSGPAFRLPFQALSTNNHIAQWTERIVVVE